MTAAELDFATVTEELFALCRKGGVSVVGVAAASAFSDAPEGYRPVDVLPNAQSVLVLGGSAPRAGEWLSPQVELMESVGTADRVTVIGMKIARHIEETYGYYALTVPPGTDKGDRPFVSIALAAEMDGCGSRTLAGPIMHPEPLDTALRAYSGRLSWNCPCKDDIASQAPRYGPADHSGRLSWNCPCKDNIASRVAPSVARRVSPCPVCTVAHLSRATAS